jgi:tRNA pseudouridine55 synthase
MFGLLNIDKPAGVTSREVVNRVQRLVRPHKVGHAGTLDPLATGVLVMAIGPATRLIEYVQRMPKTYQGTFLLGRMSDTEDVEGHVVELPNPSAPTRENIVAAIPRFLGTIKQRPPGYSAIKVAGRPAYKLARRGEVVELAPRPVKIQSIDLVRYEYPEVELRVQCGGGTYIRSLGRDLAESLGTGAVMSALRRLAIGPFKVDEAVNCESLSALLIAQNLRSPLQAVGQLPQIDLNNEQITRISQGQTILAACDQAADEIAAVDHRGQLVALLKLASDGKLAPMKCFRGPASH